MKDNQITGKRQRFSEIVDNHGIKAFGKHIPVECWSEIKYDMRIDGREMYKHTTDYEIMNSCGRTYLVTKQAK